MAKRALLIGINRYQIPGADLRGCVNDVENLTAVLRTLYGFPRRNIVTLTDLRATKKAIQSAIRALISKGREGDVLFLHFSGHGSNVPDDNGDEADRRDEILCPTDLDWRDPLRDDWLRSELDKVRDGVSLTVVMDCCHSGSNTRALPLPDAPVIERFLPCPLDLMASESGRRLSGRVRGELRRSSRARRRASDVVHVDVPELLITGCRDTQTSADAFIGGAFNGALTYSLCTALRAARGRISYAELHQRTLAQLERGRFDQVPQLEGRRTRFDQPFLSPLV